MYYQHTYERLQVYADLIQAHGQLPPNENSSNAAEQQRARSLGPFDSLAEPVRALARFLDAVACLQNFPTQVFLPALEVAVINPVQPLLAPLHRFVSVRQITQSVSGVTQFRSARTAIALHLVHEAPHRWSTISSDIAPLHQSVGRGREQEEGGDNAADLHRGCVLLLVFVAKINMVRDLSDYSFYETTLTAAIISYLFHLPR